MEKMETTRINLNMSNELVKKVDNYAAKMCITRTSAICVLLSQALDSQKAMNDLGELLKLYKQQNNVEETIIDNKDKLICL
jgi:metal-responsive CopG/Arc/MetJ family transcriptional regulator